MHRNSLLDQLEIYRRQWPAETQVVTRLSNFVKEHSDCFERSLPCGHITASAWVVNAAGTHVLLTHHRKLNIWVQLGGHVDGNPDVLDGALREATEESGLQELIPVSSQLFDVDIHRIPERKSEPAHDHYDLRFAFRAAEGGEYIVSDESHDLAWVDVSQLNGYSQEASMLRMALKWQSR